MESMTLRPNYAERVAQGRSRANLSREDLARISGISERAYYDLEDSDDELPMCLSLEQVHALASALRLSVWQLAAPDPSESPPPTLELPSFLIEISNYMDKQKLSVAAFSDLCGWDISDTLGDPQRVMTWNLDELVDVSKAAGVDWRRVIGTL